MDPNNAPAGGGQARRDDTQLRVSIAGMHCASCAMNVRRALESLPGVRSAAVDVVTGTADIRFAASGTPDLSAVERAVAAVGFRVLRSGSRGTAADEGIRPGRLALTVGIAAMVAVLAMGAHLGWTPLPHRISAVVQGVLVTAIIALNAAVYRRGIAAVVRRGVADMSTLVSIGTGAAYLHGVAGTVYALSTGGVPHEVYFESAGVVLAVVRLGEWLSWRARRAATSAVSALGTLQPAVANVIADGVERPVPVERLAPGDVVMVRAGQRIPADGVVRAGDALVDESLITGESDPLRRSSGDRVVAGALVVDGSLTLVVESTGEDTVLGRVISFVRDAQGSRPPLQHLADAVAARFVPAVGLGALLVFVVWMAAGAGLTFAMRAAIAVLVVACPCALGLAIPVAVVRSIGLAARAGMLVRDARALQAASQLTDVVLDKTGTLTVGRPAIVEASFAPGAVETSALSLAASLESCVTHPLAAAVVAYARERGAQMRPVAGIEARGGLGVTGTCDGHAVLVGSRECLNAERVVVDPGLEAAADRAAAAGRTVVWIAVDGQTAAVLAIGDEVRHEAAVAVAELTQLGIRVHVVSGDHAPAVRAAAAAAGIASWSAGVAPAAKAGWVERLRATGARVAVVGDGINDAPAVAVADVGIAVGGAADIAAEAADVVLMRADLRLVPALVRLSRITVRVMRANLFWAFAYNVGALPIAAGALYPWNGMMLSPEMAGIAMSLSSLSVVVNSLMVRWRPPQGTHTAPGRMG